MVIVAGDASANTQKKFRDKCGTYKIPLLIGFDRDSLGSSIGKDTACCSCSYGSGFAKMISKQVGIMSEVEYIE